MSTPRYERFDKVDKTPTFPIGHPPPYEQASLPMQSQGFSATTITNVVVQQPQATGPVTEQSRVPQDYLVWSILTCFFCCCPIGLWAISASIRARAKLEDGDIEEARSSSRCALGLNVFGTLGGIAFMIVFSITYMHVYK
ncbi:trafficking regulator of GLUT4 1-like [Pecten maximus]|uniref:trafficking regulator of GLUT4 1-like n=1 Tax=Pecten maximus TaxID=6579 RepID=UPI001458FD77|nr:trafficking regulator of GLUT4 1-like [Pecten maximus]